MTDHFISEQNKWMKLISKPTVGSNCILIN